MATGETVSLTPVSSSTPDSHWTTAKLVEQFAGELVGARDASSTGGSDRLTNIVVQSFDAVYSVRPWPWRRKKGTMSLSTATSALREGTWTGASVPTLAGTYTGNVNENWTVTIDGTGTSTVGTTAGLTATVTDYQGSTIATLAIGSTYTPEAAITVADGITLAFTAATVVASDTQYIDLKADTAIFPLRATPGGSDYSNFEKLDQRWVEENNKAAGCIRFIDDLQGFDSYRQARRDETGEPQVALIEADTDLDATMLYRIHVVPAPSASLEYDFYYLTKPPVLASTARPVWPYWMNRLWYIRAKWEAYQSYGNPLWETLYRAWKALLADAESENAETTVSNSPTVEGWLGGGDGVIGTLVGVVVGGKLWKVL